MLESTMNNIFSLVETAEMPKELKEKI